MKFAFIVLTLFGSVRLTAQQTNDSLKALLSKKAGSEKVELLNQISRNCWNMAPDSGLRYATEALTLAKNISDKKGMATSLQNLGVNYWLTSAYQKSLENLRLSLPLYEEIHDYNGISSVFSNMGIVYKDISDNEKALFYFLKSLKLSDSLNNQPLYAKTLGNISLVYRALKNLDKAKTYNQQSIDLFVKLNDTISISALYNNMGRIYEEQNDLNSALEQYKKALAINIKNNNKYGITISLYNIGSVEFSLNHFTQALKYFQQSLEISQSIDDNVGILLAYKSIGLVNLKLKHYPSALKYFDLSMKLTYQTGAIEDRLDLYQTYVEYYKLTGNAYRALSYAEKYRNLKDSIDSNNNIRQMAEMQTKFDSEKIEKENELLRKTNAIQTLAIEKQKAIRNLMITLLTFAAFIVVVLLVRIAIRRKANKTLQKKNQLIASQKEELELNHHTLSVQYNELHLLNAMKDKFFKIISHDLKGPFNSILGLSELLCLDYQNLDDINRLKMIETINSSSQYAYELLTNLLSWAQAQTGEIKINKEPIEINKLIDTCIRLYGTSADHKGITVSVNIEPNLSLLADINTLQTTVGNLLTNAIKFTPNGGHITIGSTRKNDKVIITVADTGVGIAPDAIEKLFKPDETLSTQGTNNEKGTGLGLILCKEFIELNGGTIAVESEVGKGSTFTVSLPIA